MTSELPIQLFLSGPSNPNRPYYKRDVLNSCCFPVDDHLDFAFSKKWIAEEVLTQIAAGKSGLEGRRALLIFCEERETRVGDDIFLFHPIRWAIIRKAVEGGDTVTFQTKLGAFVVPGKDVDQVQQLLVGNSDLHPNHQRIAGDKPDPRSKFVRCASDDLEFGATTTDTWNALVDRLTGLRGLSDSLFLVATDNLAQIFPQFPLRSNWGASDEHKEAKVQRGSEVSLTLYGVPGKKTHFSAPKVTVSEAVARVSGPYIRQYANGYLMQYSIQFKSGWDNDRTMLRIASENAAACGVPAFCGPEFAIHLEVKPRYGALGGVIACFFVGTFLSSLDKDTLSFILDAFMCFEEKTVKNLANSLLIFLKFVGSTLIALGAFVAFRKLPGPGAG